VKESTLQRRIVAAIVRRGGHAIVTRPPGVPAGTPDVIAVYRGWCLAVEVKVDGNTTSALQDAQLARWRAGGAATLVAYNLEDAEMLLNTIDAERDDAA